MHKRVLFTVFALLSAGVLSSSSRADIIAYLSNGPAAPSNLDLMLPGSAVGTSGSFDIYFRATELVAGASLNLIATGSSIDLIGATVPAYAPRWASAQVGDVAPDGSSILAMDAFAIPGFGSNGINPAQSGSDAGYNAGADAFHYATVNYNVVAEGETTFKFVIGDIEFGVDGPIFLGTGDAAAAETGAGSAGATSALIDGRIVVGGGGGEDTIPPVITPLVENIMLPSTIVDLQLSAMDETSAASALVWSNLVYAGGPGKNPAFPSATDAMMDSDGLFDWNPGGWRAGAHTFNATVMDEAGNSTTGLALTVNLTVPEPATLSMLGLALVGCVGLIRRRG